MINKCPHCGFEPLDGKMVCPRCGEEIKENIAGKLATIKENNRENNDSVKWSDFKDVSIGSVIEESLNEATKEDELADVNPILADYIKKHKDDYEEAEPTPTSQESKTEAEDGERSISDNAEMKEELTDSQLKNKKIDERKNDHSANLADTAHEKNLAEIKDETKEEIEVAKETTELEEKTTLETKTIVGDKEIKATKSKEKEVQTEHTTPKAPMLEQLKVDQHETDDTHLQSEASIISESAENNGVDSVATTDMSNSNTSIPKTPKKKWPYILLAAALVLGGTGYGYYVYDQNVKAAAQEAQQKIEKQEATIQDKLADFYADEQHQFVKIDKTRFELDDLATQVKDLAKKATNKETKDQAHNLTLEIANIKEKITIVTSVNNLFESPIINGTEVKNDVAIKGDAPNVEPLSSGDEFAKTINGVISDAKSQFNDLTYAKQAVAILYTDDKVKENASRTYYQTAQKAVEKLVNGNQKKALAENLKKVDAALSKQEDAAAKKKQEQEAAASAANQAQNATSQQNSQKNSTLPAEASPNMHPNTENAPIMATNPSAVADSANPAWTWNSGIQEKVIQTCIERGYIVPGGYYLEPVTIENGEGYYNLFATTTQSSLLKGISAKALPYYIVTINCKTGYFRGNGNDHTIR